MLNPPNIRNVLLLGIIIIELCIILNCCVYKFSFCLQNIDAFKCRVCVKELHTSRGYDPVFVTVLAIGKFLWRSVNMQTSQNIGEKVSLSEIPRWNASTFWFDSLIDFLFLSLQVRIQAMDK